MSNDLEQPKGTILFLSVLVCFGQTPDAVFAQSRWTEDLTVLVG